MTHFPGAVQILDYYHAAGHLAEFCDLLPALMRDEHLRQWSTLLYNGEPLPLIVEMKRSVAKLTDADRGWKQINYFQNNQQRMDWNATSSHARRSGTRRLDHVNPFLPVLALPPSSTR